MKWLRYSNPKGRKSWGLSGYHWVWYQFQLMRLSQSLHENRHVKLILHNKARPHVAQSVETYRSTWEVLSHLPYFLFRSMAHDQADHQSLSYGDIKTWFDVWISTKDEHFYRNSNSTRKMIKVIPSVGNYFERFICNHFCTIKLHSHDENIENLVAPYYISAETSQKQLFRECFWKFNCFFLILFCHFVMIVLYCIEFSTNWKNSNLGKTIIKF